MKFAALFIFSMLLAGCAYLDQRNSSNIIETEPQMVAGCASLGVLSETADAGNPFGFYATKQMLVNIRQRAAKLGATHIVWLHKTPDAAAAEAFRCTPK